MELLLPPAMTLRPREPHLIEKAGHGQVLPGTGYLMAHCASELTNTTLFNLSLVRASLEHSRSTLLVKISCGIK